MFRIAQTRVRDCVGGWPFPGRNATGWGRSSSSPRGGHSIDHWHDDAAVVMAVVRGTVLRRLCP
jgi:hypothetical protein